MKKKLFSIAAIAIIALTASWNIYQSNNEVRLSSLALNNIEALARGEGIDQDGHRLVNNCCRANEPREYKCSSAWPDC